MKALQAVGLVFVFFFFWAGVMGGGAIAMANGEEEVGIGLAILSVAGFLLGLLPFMQWLSGRLFYYQGEGEAVETAVLRQKLLNIAEEDLPVSVEERRNKLVVSLKVADAKWWNILSRSGLQRVYELHIKLNDKKKTATLIDVSKSVDWRAGPGSVRLRGGFSRGVDLSYERVLGYGWDDAFQFGKVVDFKFKNTDIKHPVLNLIVANGWNVRFGLW